MNYRLAQLTDIPAFVAIEQAQPRCAQWALAGWKTELAEKSAYVCCAEEEGRVVGFLALRMAAGVAEILNVGVNPLYLRRGLGQTLLERSIMWLRTQKCEQLTLEVGARNLAAIGLYQKVGFTRIGVRKNFYRDGEDAWIMEFVL